MFHSAAVKLTVWYLSIILALSIGFSLAIYHVSGNELRENAGRQVGYFRGLLGSNNASEFATLRQGQLNEDLRHLKANLIFFNILVLAGGGAASYALARRTLHPIEDALETQTRFAADASHELRTPLAAMQTENEVALRNPHLSNSQSKKLLKSNLEEINKLKMLFDGLLSLAHTNGDEGTEQVDIGQVISDAYDRVKKAAGFKKIKISLSESLTETVAGNRQKLTDLVVILLDNAIKYSRSGGRVALSTSRQSKKAIISVSDEGQGIKRSDLPRVFERFYRADNSRSKNDVEGYGLGLAIAKKIADQHKGTIEVKSAFGKGSTFTVKLPLQT